MCYESIHDEVDRIVLRKIDKATIKTKRKDSKKPSCSGLSYVLKYELHYSLDKVALEWSGVGLGPGLDYGLVLADLD